MSAGLMHADEVVVTAPVVAALLVAQFPAWAGLPLDRVPSSGTDNAIFRLGSGLAVRLPRYPGAVSLLEKELRWVPHVAPYLPCAVPEPVAAGAPGDGYPFPWAVCRWVDGVNPGFGSGGVALARDLAAFVVALRGVPAEDGPGPGSHNFGRGRPLAERDAFTREAIAELDGVGDGLVDVAAVTAAWDRALAAPAWDGPPVWVHGDIAPGNVLVSADGRLSSVIDFGGLGVGDPACDLMVAWTLLSGEARAVFRALCGLDDAAWERGRGWALSVALVALPYYLRTNPGIVALSRHAVDQALCGS